MKVTMSTLFLNHNLPKYFNVPYFEINLDRFFLEYVFHFVRQPCFKKIFMRLPKAQQTYGNTI